MAFSAGQTLTAAQLNRVQPTTYIGVASVDLTLSTTETDVTGATVTFSTQAANAVFVVTGSFDFYASIVSGTTTMQGRCAVDGSSQTGEADATLMTSGSRVPGAKTWRGTLAASGSHTIKLRGLKDVAAGTYQILSTHTRILVVVYEVI